MSQLWPPSIVWIDAFGAGIFAMTAVHHLDQWNRRRDRPSHLWIALSALGALIVNLSGAAMRDIGPPPGRLLGTANMVGIAVALISLYELVRANAGARAHWLRRVLEVLAFLPALLWLATGNGVLQPVVYLLSFAFMLGALAASLRPALSGDIEARVLSIGLIGLFVALAYDMASSLRLLPRQEGWPILGFALLYLAATRAQSIRAEREYKELQSLRHELEERVRERTAALEAANADLDRLSRTDQLTGLGNRRSLIEDVQQVLLASGPTGSLVMIDVDHFKQINDQLGHDTGDDVLVAVGAALRDSLGAHAILARWGGEEFIAYLPGMGIDEASRVAEAARAKVATLRTGPDDRRALSASFGVAEVLSDFDTALADADAAMYRAKHAGRDRVALAERRRS